MNETFSPTRRKIVLAGLKGRLDQETARMSTALQVLAAIIGRRRLNALDDDVDRTFPG